MKHFKSIFSNIFRSGNDIPEIDKFQVIVLANNLTVNEITLIDKRQFYDTTWLLKLVDAGEEKIIKIVRDDLETLSHFASLVAKTNSISQLLQLDCKNSILYD